MLARLTPTWVVVLVILASLGTLLGSQRRVVVSSSDGLDLRWTAYRLGVSVERMEQGRRALQIATDLAPHVAGRESVGSLGDMWLAPLVAGPKSDSGSQQGVAPARARHRGSCGLRASHKRCSVLEEHSPDDQ